MAMLAPTLQPKGCAPVVIRAMLGYIERTYDDVEIVAIYREAVEERPEHWPACPPCWLVAPLHRVLRSSERPQEPGFWRGMVDGTEGTPGQAWPG